MLEHVGSHLATWTSANWLSWLARLEYANLNVESPFVYAGFHALYVLYAGYLKGLWWEHGIYCTSTFTIMGLWEGNI